MGVSGLLVISLAVAGLAMLVYLIFHNIAYKNIFKRFKQYKRQRYGFYECGFRPKHEVSIEISLHSYIICALVILYDVEGLFLLIFLLNVEYMCLLDLLIILFYVILLFVGFYFDLISGSTRWQIY